MNAAGGKRRETKHLEGIVGDLLRKWKDGKVRRAGAVMTAWEAAVSGDLRIRMRLGNYRNGTLIVIVENSSWLYKLTLERKKILEKFNAHYTGRKKAKDIRFRIGSLSEE
ncbi:MAG: DUF721 domain-containing protein [Candidatus Omnitrophota bacterium]